MKTIATIIHNDWRRRTMRLAVHQPELPDERYRDIEIPKRSHVTLDGQAVPLGDIPEGSEVKWSGSKVAVWIAAKRERESCKR